MPIATDKGSVFLVDDDFAVQRGIRALLKAADYQVTSFRSGDEFLEKFASLELERAVLLVDVCMPGIQGLELQEKLCKDNVPLPVIVMTALGDISMAVRAMRNGAVDFLEKPFTVEEIVSAIDRALALPGVKQNSTAVAAPAFAPEIQEKYNTLTPREREVLTAVIGGQTNKEIARAFDLSPRTIEVHRQKMMLKMNAKNFAELVRMTISLDLSH